MLRPQAPIECVMINTGVVENDYNFGMGLRS